MAVQDAILRPGQAKPTKQNIGGLASGAEILLGSNAIFSFVGDTDAHIAFGNAGMGVADATDFFIPANTIVVLDTGDTFTSVRIFNTGAGAQDFYVLRMSKH